MWNLTGKTPESVISMWINLLHRIQVLLSSSWSIFNVDWNASGVDGKINHTIPLPFHKTMEFLHRNFQTNYDSTKPPIQVASFMVKYFEKLCHQRGAARRY